MCDEKQVIIMDLDGTLFDDFFEADRDIIEDLFNKNSFVLFVDFMARIINSIGFIKNTTRMLKLRLLVYSILSNKNYNRILLNYRKAYVNKACEALKRNYHYVKELNNLNYEVLILSNNRYSASLSILYKVETVKNKPEKIKQLYEKYGKNLRFVVGDNYFDEILPSRRMVIPNIYIRLKNPSIAKCIKAKDKECYYSESLEDAVNIIKGN